MKMQSLRNLLKRAKKTLQQAQSTVVSEKSSLTRILKRPLGRRAFLQSAAATTVAAAAAPSEAEAAINFESFFQKHYREMTPDDKKRVFARLEKEISAQYDNPVSLSDPEAIPGVKFAFCLSLSKCNGSRRCVYACQKENNQDEDIHYIKVLEMPRGSLNVEKSNLYYDNKTVPQPDKFYLPVQCNQCDNPPCVKACPIEATWKEKDGIVVIDSDWCIGCRYCQAACPYEARHFNFRTPKIDPRRFNPQQSYLSNRVRARGVMEKCTFCLHRTRKGYYPACLEACPTGARKFGNINDPKSEVAQIIKQKRVFVLKEELNTIPSFFYYFD